MPLQNSRGWGSSCAEIFVFSLCVQTRTLSTLKDRTMLIINMNEAHLLGLILIQL